MTLTEKISSLTDLELAELWDLNHVFTPKKVSKIDHLKSLYDLIESAISENKEKELIEAMKAEIIKRYLNQNQIKDENQR